MTSGQVSARFEIARTMADADWDLFLARCPGRHHEQSAGWARVKHLQGWDSYRILVRSEGNLIGGTQVLCRRVRNFVTIGYVVYGPVATTDDLLGVVTRQVVEGLKIARFTYLVVLPGFNWVNVVSVLKESGFFPKPNVLPPSNLATATLLLDLTPDLDVLFSRMRRSTRKGIRKGLKAGLEVSLGGESDLDTAHALMCQQCTRRGTTPEPPQAKDFHNIWREMAPTGAVKLFLARYRGEIVASILAFSFGDTLRAWKGGWSGRFDEYYPNHVICWEAIRWAKLAGLRCFDFVQVIPEHAKAVQRGETIDDSYWGVTHFKLGFGGDLVVIPDAYFRSSNSAAQLALRLGAASVLGSPQVLRMVKRFSMTLGKDT